MSHDIVVATHIGGQLVYVVHTSITTARRRILYLTGQIFKLTHPVDHSIFSGYEFEGGGNEIWSLHDFAPVVTIIMNKDGTPLGVIRNIYGITCYIDNEI